MNNTKELLPILMEISRNMNSSLGLGDILTNIIATAKEYIGVERVSVFLMEDSVLRMRACAGFVPDETIEIQLGEGITGSVAKTGKPITNNNGKKTPGLHSDYSYSAKSYMSLPILSDGKVIGVLNLTDKEGDHFNETDMQIAEYIAVQCALAVERSNLYQQLVESERLQTVGLLRASIVHDIRNMLGIVESYLALVEDDPSIETINEYFLAIRSEISRVQSLANDMLDYSKNKITLNYSEFYLDELCTQVAKEINLSLRYTDVSVCSENRGHVLIYADEERLFRVIFNLINNAVQAIEDKGEVHVRSYVTGGGFAVILVYDTGKGIPEHMQKTIFEPFQGYGKVKSTGLGLAIVSDIVSAHSGKLKLRSVEGKYTVFRIKLPLNI